MAKEAGSVDYGLVTQRQQESWATGDFHEVARQNVCMAEALCEAVDPHATDCVLDIACGSGTAALVAARRYCEVAGIDYVPVLSVYGVQFAADQEKAAKEMLRVCKPGGRIGLATPIPKGWSGDFFAVNAAYSPPPPPGVKPPLRWGTDEGLD